MLLGEGTFHQYHGGVASNAPLATHPYRQMHEEYRRLKGRDFQPPTRRPFFQGRLPDEALPAAAASAQRGLRFWQEEAPAFADFFAIAGSSST